MMHIMNVQDTPFFTNTPLIHSKMILYFSYHYAKSVQHILIATNDELQCSTVILASIPIFQAKKSHKS